MVGRVGRATGTGCLAVVAGVVLGIVAAQAVSSVVLGNWGDCLGVSPGYAAELASRGPLDHLFESIAFLGMYLFAFPAGFLAVMLTGMRGDRTPRLELALLAGLGLLGAVAALDLWLHVVPPDGHYLDRLCPRGRPSWWPSVLPLPDHGPARPLDGIG